MKIKKIIISILFSIFAVWSLSAKSNFFKRKNSSKNVIRVWSYTEELPELVRDFLKCNPDFGWDVEFEVTPIYYGEGYESVLSDAIFYNSLETPDIFTLDDSMVLQYTKEHSNYLLPFDQLGIDMDSKLQEGKVAQYTVDIGSNPEGQVVGLTYESTGGVFAYRRSIAREVFGTDNPDEISKIIGGGSGEWSKFMEAAEQLYEHDYKILSGYDDLWRPVSGSAEKGWIVDGKVYVDPKRAAYLDFAKTLYEKGYTNYTEVWDYEWYNGMKDEGENPVFGYFGPAWFINYVLEVSSGDSDYENCTYGDWAICESPAGFFWGGSWIHVNANLAEEKKNAVKEIIDYICLNTTENGLQYKYALGGFNYESKGDSVALGTVMEKLNSTSPFLGNQNMFPVIAQADKAATGKNQTKWDEYIDRIWQKYVDMYVTGKRTKKSIISDFSKEIAETYGLSTAQLIW